MEILTQDVEFDLILAGGFAAERLNQESRINTVHDAKGKFAKGSSSGHISGDSEDVANATSKSGGKPNVVSRAEFDKQFPDSDNHLWRGVSGSESADKSRQGRLGNGDYGKGQYWGDDVGVAQSYMQKFQGDKSGRAIRAAIDPGKKPVIKEIPSKVRSKGPEVIDKWADDNGVDVVDTGDYMVVRNPAVLVADSHNYTLDETNVIKRHNKGYEIPDKYAEAAKNLGISRSNSNGLESRASQLSQVERRIVKKPNICEQCRLNDDPRKVPVHPHCDCDVVTDSIQSGVADPASRFMQLLNKGNIDIEDITGGEFHGQLQMDAATAAIMDAENVRFSDIARWLETMQPYLDNLDRAYDYIAFALDDDNQEAVEQVQETVDALTDNTETVAEAVHSRKLWFALAKAVAL